MAIRIISVGHEYVEPMELIFPRHAAVELRRAPNIGSEMKFPGALIGNNLISEIVVFRFATYRKVRAFGYIVSDLDMDFVLKKTCVTPCQ
ncbi:hypothetical protein QQP08_013481 [Theobroma cacao]|nr:hypothetical protein QQP08_013481 [Theobroma cacao]